MPAITPLATFQPPCTARTWLSAPHPHLPIIATACSDRSARVYSLQTFQQQSVISGGHKRSIRSCAWKPNSVGESVLATGSFDASAGIWKRWEENAGRPKEVDFTSGLAGGGAADEEEEDDEWRFAVILDGHESEIKSLAFSPVAPLLATSSRDKSVWIWEELDDDNFETVAVLQDHEGDVKCVAWHPSEALLASGSYDDTIRLWREDLDDWACCSLLKGHKGTVWWVEFEGVGGVQRLGTEGISEEQKKLLAEREETGPRLLSCSEDRSIRIWRRIPKEKSTSASAQAGTPSIWKNRDFEEEWVEETRLPAVHDSAVYAVSWSKKTGRIVSAGSDGRIVVYEERLRSTAKAESNGDTVMSDGENGVSTGVEDRSLTEWVVVADIDNSHDVFEINHVCWAPRADKGRRYEGEEILVSTGDDGEVRAWTFDP
ncbi:cytosolic iron-sulfur protein assembly protein 1 [Neohortaea acidophila]|uniref:Probable cytosolic iron-sulfur protein assembly protein 1 n=1 Tax=Neohortaea acidophila TaxID=245834 RepID=A0A6A6PKP0_9PEZI|nr:cytosolic iron-sulfur protein assembly protein 1 [Neohortaea acidophila]KAF2480063.1 cytosolic iron-sulfur protein assembly protein 1 [Neohortaea acidophila]